MYFFKLLKQEVLEDGRCYCRPSDSFIALSGEKLERLFYRQIICLILYIVSHHPCICCHVRGSGDLRFKDFVLSPKNWTPVIELPDAG